MKNLKTRALVLCALFCALVSIGAQLTIPIPYGSITLQLFFVILTGILLPPLMSLLSLSAYLILGLVGAPVFAGFHGGLSSVMTPTFGFVLGFVAAAPLISLSYRAMLKRIKPFAASLTAGLIGIAVCYVFGAVYGYFYMRLATTETITLWFILWNWCLIYLPFDAAKGICAALVAPPLLKRLPAAK